MPKSYHHLTLHLRCQISALKASGRTQKSIAKQLNISESTVSRELSRNKDIAGNYDFIFAEILSNRRKRNANHIMRKMQSDVEQEVIACLKQYWSPEQISGRLKLKGINISHETIYKYIWRNRHMMLYLYLRRQGKKYRKKKGKYGCRSKIPDRVDIRDRPKIVDEKVRIGDWEGDTIVGSNHQGAILSYVERKTKFTILNKIEQNNSNNVVKATNKTLGKHKDKVHTVTYDNGSEFSKHGIIAKKLEAKCYFAQPYKAWERGLNEHTNGLVRQFIPKKTAISTVSDRDVKKVENYLNDRPRKVLGYKTPREVFLQTDVDPLIALAG